MNFITYKVKITTKTGLHIGAGNELVEIGGMDQPIVKDKDGFPYIPGSSLKGKLRSLYEIYKFGKDLLKEDGNHLKSFDGKEYDEVSMFFGNSGKKRFRTKEEKKEYNKNLEKLGPTRFIFRDLKLSEESKKELKELKEKGEKYLDEKIECSIDRKDGIAKNGALRPIERVFSGITFEGDLIVRLFGLSILKEEEKENLRKFGEKFKLEVLKKLLENDYLGGQGTRGSGQVEIIFEPNEIQLNKYLENFN